VTPVVALTIAGSDSGGGAGVQADLKSFAANHVFGTSAITAVTAQNTRRVAGIHVLPAAFVDSQIAAVIDDMDVQAVKTGMLATAEIVQVVAERAASGRLPNLVVDPVMVASSGDRLLDDDALKAYLDLLFPLALVVTPNLREASLLLRRPIETVADMERAARGLHRTGASYVVIKGGHLQAEQATDVVFDGDAFTVLEAPWVETANVHGTGCTFAAATAAHLARGRTVLDALHEAKRYVHTALSGAADWSIGEGHGPLDHFGWG
jgi:hydroxymethylpyrimidine/phosphomethylpyrimidine kinase